MTMSKMNRQPEKKYASEYEKGEQSQSNPVRNRWNRDATIGPFVNTASLDGPVIDPNELFDLDKDLWARSTPPLLLLPMRLEYRVIERAHRSIFVDTTDELRALERTSHGTGSSRSHNPSPDLSSRRKVISRILATGVKTAPLRLTDPLQIWFRWYPDEGFSEKGIEPVTDDETIHLAAFNEAIGGKSWYDVSDEDVSAAWQTFAGAVGGYRAIHLLRGSVGQDAEWEKHIGRIVALPQSVTLFAVIGSSVTALATGKSIPRNTDSAQSVVSYTPQALEPGGWLHDFAIAEKHGMGLKLVDQSKINLALKADWIVAVGMHDASANQEIEHIFRDGISNGNFEFLPQDAPTNNSPGSRSIYASPHKDPISFIQKATHHEAGEFGNSRKSAAGLLAEALGIDTATVRKAVSAADQGYEDARAMLRVVGPALLDDAVDGVSALSGIDENEFIDVLATAIVARGVLPAVRFGKNAYGILPMTQVDKLKFQGKKSDISVRVNNMMASYASFLKPLLMDHADDVVPVLEPDDPDASNKVERILKTNRVSRRVDVGDAGSDETSSIGCPYVSGRSPVHQPQQYLTDILTKPIQTLVDPTSESKAWPLLYRLARLTLIRNTLVNVVKAKRPTERHSINSLDLMDSAAHKALLQDQSQLLGLSIIEIVNRTSPIKSVHPSTQDHLRTLNASFSAALRQLVRVAQRPNGTAELEALMLEVVDLFQHRVDAWAVGLAYQQLLSIRQRGQNSLRAGYYGFLAKLRPESLTGRSDGYIQAPSIAQATSAAVLRSAYLRHRADGAFEIDLRSRRVRRATALLDMIKKGLPLKEVLGLRGERWLHDKKLSRLTLTLRSLFPIKNPVPPESESGQTIADPESAGHRVFDGLEFIESDLDDFSLADQNILKNLQAQLEDDIDALSDVVVAEAVHQRTMGQSEAANAWLQILAGDPIPGDPSFLRTQRHGQGSTHRISVLLEEGASSAKSSPRVIAEPTLAAFAEKLMPGFNNSSFTVVLTRTEDPAQSVQLTVRPFTDLGMEALDMVIGGQSELQVRTHHYLIGRWLTDSALASQLGIPSALGLQAFVNAEVTIEIDTSAGSVSLDSLLATATRIRALVQRGRPLAPSDLNASASPLHALTEAHEVMLINGSIGDLRLRVASLEARLQSDLTKFIDAKQAFVDHIREARRQMDLGEPDDVILMALVSAESARRALADRLRTVSAYAEPEALRPFTVEEAVADPDLFSETLNAIQQRLETKRLALNNAGGQAASGTADILQSARQTQRTLVETLQSTLDGEALPILPVVLRDATTTPLLNPSTTDLSFLDDWREVREGVRRAVDELAGVADIKAYKVALEATEDDVLPDEKDSRSEEDAPRSKHFGVYLGTDSSVLLGETFVGFISDEWTEQRPSQNQTAAMALNYDSPQSEPPQCLLLCVPPDNNTQIWTSEKAAEMVLETIHWMKIRALSTDEKPTPASLLPNANQVPFKKTNSQLKRRIPTSEFRLRDLGGLALDGEFVLVEQTDTSLPLGIGRAGVNQTVGFFKKKE